jgi:putative cardiolipin synthase
MAIAAKGREPKGLGILVTNCEESDLKQVRVIYFLLLFAFLGTGLVSLPVSMAAPLCRESLKAPLGLPEVKLLLDPKESLAVKLAAIRSAKVSIDISYYIFSHDNSGKLLLAELQAAARRGVKVRLLVDAVGSWRRNEDDLRRLFVEFGGAEVVIANPNKRLGQVFRHLLSLILRRPLDHSQISGNNRSHDKIIIVDSRFAIIGGRNVGDLYTDVGAHRGRASEDFEVAIKDLDGRALSQLKLHFEVLFTNSENLVLSQPLSARPASLAEETRQILHEEKLEMKIQEMEQADQGGSFKPSQIEFVSDVKNLVKSHKILDGELWSMATTRRSILQRLFTAQRSALIVTPFLILSPRDIARIGKHLRSNPKVTYDFYTNSINSDSILSQAYHDRYVAPLLIKLREDPAIGDRLRLHAFMPDPQKGSVILVKRLHGKVILIDDAEVLITTSNFDPRSFKANSEIGVWVSLDSKDAGDLITKIQTLKQDSDQWGSAEWRAKRDNPLFGRKVILQKWLAKLLDILNLSSAL